MPSTDQRIHAGILLGIFALAMGGVVSGLLWCVLAASGDVVGAAAASIATTTSASLLLLTCIGQTAWTSYSRIRVL